MKIYLQYTDHIGTGSHVYGTNADNYWDDLKQGEEKAVERMLNANTKLATYNTIHKYKDRIADTIEYSKIKCYRTAPDRNGLVWIFMGVETNLNFNAPFDESLDK